MSFRASVVSLTVAVVIVLVSVLSASAVQRGQGLNDRFTPSWKDNVVPAQATRVNPATSLPHFDTFIGNTKVLWFDATTTETVTFELQMNHDYSLGTDIRPHVHWAAKGAGPGNLIWTLGCTSSTVNGTFNDPVTMNYTTATTLGAMTHHYTNFATSSGILFTSHSMIYECYLSRDATQDTYDDDAAFLGVDFHYQADRIGSDNEYTSL